MSLKVRFEIWITHCWRFVWTNLNERFINHNTIKFNVLFLYILLCLVLVSNEIDFMKILLCSIKTEFKSIQPIFLNSNGERRRMSDYKINNPALSHFVLTLLFFFRNKSASSKKTKSRKYRLSRLVEEREAFETYRWMCCTPRAEELQITPNSSDGQPESSPQQARQKYRELW